MTLIQLFEKQVECNSEKIAVTFQNESLSYAELNRRANQLAHYILRNGAQDGKIIGLCTSRSLNLVVGLLAILKVGAAYLPLDPDYPDIRLAYMMEDANISLLITEDIYLHRFTNASYCKININDVIPELGAEPDIAPLTDFSQDDLAYVIYTSGSSGKPKGVMISHENLSNLLISMGKEPGIKSDDKLLAVTTIAFDISGLELWLPLTHGAQLIIAPAYVSRNASALIELIHRHSISFMQATPATWQMLLLGGFKSSHPMKLLCGGDRLTATLAKALLSQGHELWNVYGPTETTIWSAVKQIHADEKITIGRPIENTSLYVLDEHLQEVPLGVEGVLYIGGKGLARGYIKQPRMTAEKFIDNPFSQTAGDKLYCTDDIARFLDNGEIEILSRKDDQVKIRGHRIELGEIENCLQNYPLINDAVVKANAINTENKQLVAYFTLNHAALSPELTQKLERIQVEQWNNIYSDYYQASDQDSLSKFNIAGWNSSYTRSPIADTEMQEWVDDTVERIKSLKPKRVLEVGCGSGLLLARLAPTCSEYFATDISKTALQQIEKLRAQHSDLQHVKLFHNSADQIHEISDIQFDVIILNSVIQYFPSANYLEKIIKNFIDLAAEDGKIFIGDVRNYDLIKLFYTSVKHYQAKPDLENGKLQQQIMQAMYNEEELLLSSAYFHALPKTFHAIKHVQTLLKQGRYSNEMTLFRFDAILHVQHAKKAINKVHPDWLLISDYRKLVDVIVGRLNSIEFTSIGIRGIPNKRLTQANQLQDWMEKSSSDSQLNGFICIDDDMLDIADIKDLMTQYGCVAEFSWNKQDATGAFDLIIYNPKKYSTQPIFSVNNNVSNHTQDPSIFCNYPLIKLVRREIIPALRDYLHTMLPEYMLPSQILCLDKLPQTSNGKIDKRKLPNPDYSRSNISTNFSAPQTEIENQLAAIWQDIFGIEVVGLDDDFFELGGDSLLAMQFIGLAEQQGIIIDSQSIFSHATIRQITEIIEPISECNNILLHSVTPLTDIDSDIYLLTGMQSGILFQHLIDPEIYLIQGVISLQGNIDIFSFKKAWEFIINRHAVLRTGIIWEDVDIPMQYISPTLTLPWHEYDWSGETDSTQADLLKSVLKSDKQNHFTLNRPPLFRLHLIKRDQTHYYLLWSFHHIILDGWCLSLIMRDLCKAYEDIKRNAQIEMPEPRQYREYVQWFQSQDVTRATSFWRDYLANFTGTSALPVKINKRDEGGHVLKLNVDLKLTKQIKDFVKANRLTMNIFILVAWGALLSRYTQQDDVVFGVTLSGRNISLPKASEIVGPLINTIPLRLNFSENITFLELLSKTRKDFSSLMKYAFLPLSRINQLVSLSDRALFESIVVFDNDAFDLSEISTANDLRINGVEWNEQTEYPLMLGVSLRQTLELRLSYQGNQFDALFIERLSENFLFLLASICADGQQTSKQIDIVSRGEREIILNDWNPPQSDIIGCEYFHQLFELSAERNPENIALIDDVSHLNYRNLNDRANQLAHQLINRGILPGAMVAIYADRSIELVIGLLAILKTGAAYVVLDPSYPVDRLQFIINDTQANALLINQSDRNLFPTYTGLMLGLQLEDYCHNQKTNPLVKIPQGSVAYVMYTSGSTGAPKGVLNSHAAISNRLLWTLKTYETTERDKFLQLAAVGFDISIWEMIFPLSVGASLVIAGPEKHKNIEYITYKISEHQVTILHLVPSLLELFLEYTDATSCASVKIVLCGGELLSTTLRRKFYDKLNAELYHGYGPTEAAISVTHYNCRDATYPDCVPIGKPITNANIYLLDKNLKLLPIGVSGELYIGGACLADGYLNREDLTDKVFVSNPFREGRIYKTGDMARYLPDGNIEFLGRQDNQVKLYGHRIELAEIELIIRQHEAVRDVLIIMNEDPIGHKYLAAYVLTKVANKAELDSQLKDLIREKLPDYMMPSAFEYLSAWPLTPNGKIDRTALPKSTRNKLRNASSTKVFVSSIEEELAIIWQELLAIDVIDPHDNFFSLGGDSIICIQVVSRSRRKGIFFDIKDIFQYPTLHALSAVATKKLAGNSEQTGLHYTGEIPLTPIQEHFFKQTLKNIHHFNQSILLDDIRSLSIKSLEAAMSVLLNRHEMLNIRFNFQNGRWSQRCVPVPPPMEICHHFNIANLNKDQQRSFIIEKSAVLHKKINIFTGPIIQVALFECGTSEPQKLLFVAHHLVIDNISWGILIDDLQFSMDSKLPVNSAHYYDWSMALQEYAKTEKLHQELPYWLAVEPKEVIQLPFDFETKNPPIASIKKLQINIQLNQLPNHLAAEMQIILLTAFALGYHHWSHSPGLHLMLEGHGRENIKDSIDLAHTIGWFTSLFPVFFELKELGCVIGAFKEIKQQIKNIPEKGVGYGILKYLSSFEGVGELRRQQDPSISFNFLGNSQGHHYMQELEGLICPDNPCEYLLSIESQISNHELEVTFYYSEEAFKVDSIFKLASNFKTYFLSLIAELSSRDIVYVPADFPLANISQSQLDTILSKYSDIEDMYALSSTQWGMFFQTQLEQNSDIYFTQGVYSIQGIINEDLFQQAWQRVINHYPILRTGILWEGLDEPVQYVVKTVTLPWEMLDWRYQKEVEYLQMLESWLLNDRKKPFDLSLAPLMRICLIRLSSDKSYLVWSQHHILLDGWCLGTLLQNVSTIYHGLLNNAELELPFSPPYRQYIHWLKQQDTQTAKLFWQNYLHGFNQETRLNIKLDPHNSEDEYERDDFSFTEEQKHRILKFNKEYNVTLNTLLQCAWGILLCRYTRQDDVVFGITQSGRSITLENAENIVGLFINTLPLRFRLQSDEPITSLLHRLQIEMSSLYQYGYTSLTNIQAWSSLKEERTLFESLFIFENFPQEDTAHFPKTYQLSTVHWAEKTEYPITISVSPGDELKLTFFYKTSHFNAAVIKNIIAHFQNILLAMVDCQNVPANQLSFLTKEETTLLLDRWNQTDMDVSKISCLHRLIEEQVLKTPKQIAVTSNGINYNYSELNERANQLAHYLVSQGVRPQTIVAFCTDRSIYSVITLLAIIKVSGIYLPLDVDYPDERLFYIMKDSEAKFLITQLEFKDKFSAYAGHIIFADLDEAIMQMPIVNLSNVSKPDDCFYVIYTSGSTGKPKGVMITHLNIINFLMDMQKRLEIDSKSCWLAMTTFTFDIAGLEIYLPLLVGARIFLAERQDAMDVDRLIRLIHLSQCTIMQATPSTWRMLLTAGWQRPENLRVLSGGEALPPEVASGLNIRPSDAIINLYGPTEATVWSTAAILTGKTPEINIGHPISNTRIYLLDPHMQLLPCGIPGEIVIAGAGVAKEYLNRPELTADRFVTITINENKRERVYRTGDLGRYLFDGSIEFLGRLDQQIKLHGYRIELGEIEDCLSQLEAVENVVVVPHKNAADDVKLIAHIVPAENKMSPPINFSLFYFSAYQDSAADPYRLLFESTKFADQSGFKAIWTPERHFHEVGGQYPNPSVLSAALAAITTSVDLRAGSVVLPLHHPLRVAEEWSLVDNISQGRVGIAFASGWNPKDFAFFPDRYEKRKDILADGIVQVKSLWRGDQIDVLDGLGHAAKVGIFPRPIQKELPVWLTAAGGPPTFIEAGKMGVNVLTHLLGQTTEVLAEKIALYRKALSDSGYDPSHYTVTLMLHTFIWDSSEAALAISKQPFCDYLKAHISLENMAKSVGKSGEFVTESDQQDLIEMAFERYSKTASLIGNIDDTLSMVMELKKIGVDEIACLIDFGIDENTVLSSLPYLHELKECVQKMVLLDNEKIVEHLRRHLPEHMIPFNFISHAKLPLTHNGKIDRKQLVENYKPTLRANRKTKALETETHKKLAAIWELVLGVPVNNIYDNFFFLGGHSLLATQVISIVRREFKIELPLRVLFLSPTLVEFASKIDPLLGGVNACAHQIPLVIRGDHFPLSFSQKRSWFLSQLQPNKPLHNTVFAVNIDGELDISVLENAARKLILRHEILRTYFQQVDDEPRQFIAESLSFFIEKHQWHNFPEKEQRDALHQLMQKQVSLAFDLSSLPLMRILAIQLSDIKTILVFVHHHIIFDGWSRQVFLRDLSEFYNSLMAKGIATLSPLAIQYVDFSVWQQSWQEQEKFQKQLSYWNQQLANMPPPLSLRIDKRRPLELDHSGGVYKLELDKETRGKISQLASSQDVTVFMLLLSAFQVLLHRYTQEDDIIIGTPIANRHFPDVENQIGFFVNTLALRVNLADNPRFSDLLKRVKQITLNAYENQDVPFEQLVDSLRAKRELNRHPIFQIMFAVQEAFALEFPLTQCRSTFIDTGINIAQFDLTLSLESTPDGFTLRFDYSDELFFADSISNLAQHFSLLLNRMIAKPDTRIGDFMLLDDNEIRTLLLDWNDTAFLVSNDLIHKKFEDCALRNPSVIAAVVGDSFYSYHVINESANRLARKLRDIGINSENRVALCFERSVDFLISMLAILKLGASFVPLDPAYPNERLLFILEDSSCAYLLTHADLLPQFNNKIKHVINVDELLKNNDDSVGSDLNLNLVLAPDRLAYVIYTSGTTGKPKGVPITHHNLVNRLEWCQKTIPLHPKEVVLHLFSFAFDGALIATWWPLCSGATLVIPQSEDLANLTQLATLSLRESVSLMFGTPAIITGIAEELIKKTHYQPMKIIFGGEKLTDDHIRKLSPLADRLFNFYGPTECTVMCTAHEISPDKNQSASVIGRPIGNTTAYILDKYHQPVPPGVIGELYIGGMSVTTGYLNRPELNQQSFIGNPFINGEQLYKTGDYCLYQLDGSIDYIARRDNLIKLHGYRIELSEIDNVIRSYPGVNDAVSTVIDDIETLKRIVSFIAVSFSENDTQKSELLDHLKKFLPHYMLPSRIILCDSLPLNAHGKIDRAALLSHGASLASNENTYVAPQNLNEYKLKKIWEQTLQLSNVGVKDDFFTLGGHSLLIVKLIASIKNEFNCLLSIIDIFKYPTISQLALRLDNRSETGMPTILPIQTEGSKPPLFLIHPAAGTPFPYLQLSGLIEDQPLFALINPTLYNFEDKFKTIEEMADYYLSEIKKFTPNNKFRLGGWSFGGLVAREIASHLQRENKEVDVVLMFDTYNFAQHEITLSTEAEQLQHLKELNIDIFSPEAQYFKRELLHNEKLAAEYKPDAYNGRVVLFQAEESVAANSWSDHQGLTVINVSGRHYELFNPEYIASLSQSVNAIIK